MAQSDIEIKIEALLFALGRPLSRAELVKYLDIPRDGLEAAIESLTTSLAGRGVALVDDGKEISLRVGGSAAELVETVRKDEYNRDIGKAGLETLAAVLYRGPLTRAEVDFIRGVNSSQTLRTLTMRGLLRRIPNPRDERSYLYEPTTELLATLSVGSVKELPEYTEVKVKLAKLEEAYRTVQAEQDHHDSN
ncbi:MAG: SMC-Scp complex subunit ScpB [Patescibacteria group bacterium]